MMNPSYPIYKGLQQPLIYRGLKGRFIGWGMASLVMGLVSGGLIGALTSMYLGAFLTLLITICGLAMTLQRQKKGLYSKSRNKGVIIHSVNLRIRYDGN